MKAKPWNFLVIGATVLILALLAAATAVIDPFLHYHNPLPFLEYPLRDDRYENDGMARHYSYDSVLTGTSMSMNFKCSEFDALWDAQSLKIAYSGATFHELGENLRRCYSYRPKLRYVVCSLDGSRLNAPADGDAYTGYPVYLYDNNPWNDVYYLLNKEVVPKTLAVINYTRAGEKTPDRDLYGNWAQYKSFGRDAAAGQRGGAVSDPGGSGNHLRQRHAKFSSTGAGASGHGILFLFPAVQRLLLGLAGSIPPDRSAA